MRVGILGSGLMGGKLGTLFARAGHDVVFSYARRSEKLKALARKAGRGARAGTPGEAAQDADALLLAVHWSRLDDVLGQAGDLSGKVVVSCSLPMSDDDLRARGRPHLLGRRGAREAGSRSPARLGLPHRAKRGALRRVRRPQAGPSAQPRVLRRRSEGQEGGRHADPRRGVRPDGCWPLADCPLHRALLAGHRAARVPGTRRSGAGVPVRAVWRARMKTSRPRRREPRLTPV